VVGAWPRAGADELEAVAEHPTILGGLADGAQKVVLAAGIEAGEELCARAIPAFARTVGRSCNDRLPHLLVVATDQHDCRLRANLSKELMDPLLIRVGPENSVRADLSELDLRELVLIRRLAEGSE
jgi:hypothetical protein